VLFVAATPWVLRPWFLARDAFPRADGSAEAMSDADLYLNVWILAWIAHAALHAPRHLFDGNIYYPARNTIVGSENMLAHLPVTAAALAVTGNALTVLKAMVLESFVLAGLAMFLLVRHHTGSTAAALVAGTCYTFTPFRRLTIPQPQYLGSQYLPLALLAVDLWLEHRRWRALLGLAVALALQALACVYLGYFTFLVVPIYAAVRVVARPSGNRASCAAGLAAAFGAGALAVLPVALPYLRARASGVIPAQDAATISPFSFRPWTYLSPAIGEKVGLVAWTVVGADVLARLAQRARRVHSEPLPPERATWVLLGAGALLSCGPWLTLGRHVVPLPYLLLYRYLPGFSTIRAPLRFVTVVSAALSALAGYAFARWCRRIRRAPRLGAAGLLAAAAVYYAAPMPAATMPARLGAQAPEVYRWLAHQPRGGAVVELPGAQVEGDVVGNLRNARYMVASTVHWHPLVNGYTAYAPPTTNLLFGLARRLPDPGALQTLVDLVDVRWVVVHLRDMIASEAAPWRDVRVAGLVPAARFGPDVVYAVTRAPTHAWRDGLLARAAAVQPATLAGTPLASLPPHCRQGRLLALAPPPAMFPNPLPQAVPVRFENASSCPWPGLEVLPAHLVGLTYHWISPSGRTLAWGPFTRLAGDVPPHTVIVDTMLVAPPADEYGPWTCEAFLVQEGEREPIARATATVELKPWPGPPRPSQ
jgi:hypothetical protein